MLKKKSVLLWRLLLAAVIIIILFGAIAQDREGLTAFNHIQDNLTPDDWVGWIHPLGEEVERSMEVGPFDSFLECDDNSRSRIQNYFEGWEKAKYYCGYSCSDTNPSTREKNCKLVR